MRVVIHGISRHHQTNRRNVQSGGMCRVGMAKFHYLQFFSLKVEGIAFEDLGRYQGRRNLSRKSRLPEGFDEVRTYLLLYGRDRGGCGKRSCVRKPIKQELQTKEMVAMGVGDVNGREILAAPGDPIYQFP